MDGTAKSNEQSAGRIAIAGGTGFVGAQLQKALAGKPLRLIVRDPDRHRGLAGPNVEVVKGDVTRAEGLAEAVAGCDTVINLVAIIEETGGATFDGVIRHGTVNLVAAAKSAGVRRFILMSALGAMNDPAFAYFEAKWQAEQAVKSSGMAWTIFRPSIIFGPNDGFINTLADLVRKAPIIPVVGSGESKFQPVAVDEVAASFKRAVEDESTAGKIYELGGPDILTYEQLLDTIAAELGKRKPKVHVPIGLMKMIVAMTKPMPKALRPPVTSEQLKMLAVDNCTNDSATATLIGRAPRKLAGGIGYIRR